jgi:hypothetical protein
MGLDIADNTRSLYERVGSYSGVQWLRKCLIELTIEYLKYQLDVLKRNRMQKMDSPEKEKETVEKEKETVEKEKETVEKDEQDIDVDGAGEVEEETDEFEEEADEYDQDVAIEEDVKRLIQLLETWVVPFPGGAIFLQVVRYDRIRGNITEEMVKFNVAGLVHFVNCSDCDGAWSFGQVCDIVEFFNTLIQFASDKKEHDNMRERMTSLNSVFMYAKENNGYVIRT